MHKILQFKVFKIMGPALLSGPHYVSIYKLWCSQATPSEDFVIQKFQGHGPYSVCIWFNKFTSHPLHKNLQFKVFKVMGPPLPSGPSPHNVSIYNLQCSQVIPFRRFSSRSWAHLNQLQGLNAGMMFGHGEHADSYNNFLNKTVLYKKGTHNCTP